MENELMERVTLYKQIKDELPTKPGILTFGYSNEDLKVSLDYLAENRIKTLEKYRQSNIPMELENLFPVKRRNIK